MSSNKNYCCDTSGKPQRVLALRDSETESLSLSASGGAFMILARPIIEAGGVVFGCAWNENGRAVHVGVEDEEGLRRLQGSKYVQSDTRGVFSKVAVVLKSGRPVLFSGTPCQVSALYKYLDVAARSLDFDNLVTCDLICHGVTSPSLFAAYLKWLANKNGADDGLKDYKFRTKKFGWGLYYYYYYYRAGKRHEKSGISADDPYYSAFLSGNYYRESCYVCPFACVSRSSDFTIGDYWGIEKAHPSFAHNDGASVLLINSKKGVAFFDERCSKRCAWLDSDIELAIAENKNLIKPTKGRDGFVPIRRKVNALLYSGDIKGLFEDTLKPSNGVKRLIRKIIPLSVILKVRRVLRG